MPSGNTAEINATESITINPGTVVESGATFTASIVQPDTVVIPPEGQYLYDEIGNLVRDNGEGTTIEWTPYGKVRNVTKDNGDEMSFVYDAAGNRVMKSVTTSDTTLITYYVRDANGNVMATYVNRELKEQPIYGSSRVGMYLGDAKPGMEKLGLKRYELSNHLGNVLAVITDNINIDSACVTASVASVSDYYPFGLSMEGRTFSAGDYRYGFNGKEKDDKGEWGSGTHYDYGFRIYNPSIAKFLSVDPLTASYPWYTPYQFAGNTPISAIDLDGLEELIINKIPIKTKTTLKIVIDNRRSAKEQIQYLWGYDQGYSEGWIDGINPINLVKDYYNNFSDYLINKVFESQHGTYYYIQDENGNNYLIHHTLIKPNQQSLSSQDKGFAEGYGKSYGEGRFVLESAAYSLLAEVAFEGELFKVFKQEPITDPKIYLNKALKRQGLSKPLNGLKETWKEGEYTYEVRIHAAEPEYGKSGSIYRVARKREGLDINGQGAGWEYMDKYGNWYPTKTLKPGKGGNINPDFNPGAAEDTHIPIPNE